MKRKYIPLAIIGFLIVFVLGYSLGFGAGKVDNFLRPSLTKEIFNKDKGKPEALDFALFWDAWNMLHQKYVGTLDDSKLIYGAIQGMVAGTGDPYSSFLTPDEAKRFAEDLSGSFSGIGVELGIRNSQLTIIAPLAGSPAERAGLKAKDAILKIDGKDTTEMSFDEAVAAIRGPEGTKVKLTIERAETNNFEVEITRATIKVESVKYRVVNGNLGVIEVSQFGSDTSSLFSSIADRVQREKPKGLIIDLRNNPGGYLDTSVELASYFVKTGNVVVYEQSKNGDLKEYKAKDLAKLSGIPLVVLTNGGSASASEIFAGAIKDLGLGKLVGEKTFGKGSVQELDDMPGGSEIRITIAHWLTPKKSEINGKGIDPDFPITRSQADEDAGRDPQMDKAIELLK